MAIIMLKQLVAPNFVLEVGEVVTLGPLKEAHWIMAGWADDWDEDDARVFDEPVIEIDMRE